MGASLNVRWQIWAADGAGNVVDITVNAVVAVEIVDDTDRPWDSKHASRFRACGRGVISNQPDRSNSFLAQHLPCWTRYCAVARKQVGRTRGLGENSDGRYNLLLPQSRTRDCRSSSLRLSFLEPFMRCSARSLTLRLCLTFLSDFVELASLAVEACRRKARENQLLRCCGGDWLACWRVNEKGSWVLGREEELTSDGL